MDQVVYRCGDCELDIANRIFRKGGTEFALEPKVFAVLAQLVMRPGELLTRDQLLDAVWGHRYVTPSTLNRVIALARRSLVDDAEEPRFIQTVHGSGYRYVGPVEKTAMAPTEPRARFAPPASVRLPAPLHTLIGRGNELNQIDALLNGGRSLTVLGTGGMGKTQCALSFARIHADRYPDGVWFFDLAPMRRADEWLQALALALAIAPAGERELLAKIAQIFADRRALLLLDNCDRLSAGIGALAIELLRSTQHLKILATSQQQLSFVGERVLRLPPLELPVVGQPADAHELQQIAAAPAVALLLARIQDARPEFKLTPACAPAIVGICERLDGMPLALELAAARFMLLSPEQVLERLDHRFRFLVSDVAGRDHRHRNLIALLEWSFALLSPDEQRLLCWLGVFVQGWSVEAVIDLAGAFGVSPEAAVDLLTGLAGKSLASVDQSVTPPRYRLLESVREFALEQLKVLGDERRARDAHLAYVLRMTESAHADMLGTRMRERIALLAPEHGNIDSASEFAAGPGDNPQAALRIAGLLALYFKAHGDPPMAVRLCDRALAAATSMRSRERAQAEMCLGINRLFGHEKKAADAALTTAVTVSREVGDEWTEAYSSGHLALCRIHFGQSEQASEHLATVERLAEKHDDELLRGLAGLVRGWLYLAEDDTGKAIDILRSVRDLSNDFHQHHFIGMYIGLALFRRGELPGAAVEWHEAMRKAIAVGHLRGIAGSVEGCAYLAEQLGKAEEACRFLSAAEQFRQRSGSPLFSFWFRHNEAANARLQSMLGPDRYETLISVGARMRTEDVINEAGERLQEFGASPADQAS
ncbi:MAG TPA: winged helix-turn-helix domain-containing protein [Steroidobacteraceae bacterium]|nr:winged helix-turn-helix domain-containing protein [Steroidobacteraceae bacterium]